jgi:hypothetical protein
LNNRVVVDPFLAHYKIITQMYDALGLSKHKKTHIGRTTTVLNMREHNASQDDVKALGIWSQHGSYAAVYDRGLPLKGLLPAAGFDADRLQDYCLPRGILGTLLNPFQFFSHFDTEPPAALVALLFPWAEDEQEKLQTRFRQDGHKSNDMALRNFLRLLIDFRLVILQDAAVLYSRYPDISLFKFEPFNTPTFKEFAALSITRIDEAEKAARLHYQNLPEHFAASLRGVMQTSEIERKQTEAAMLDHITSLTNVVQSLLLTHVMKGKQPVQLSREFPIAKQLFLTFLNSTQLFVLSNCSPKDPTPFDFDACHFSILCTSNANTILSIFVFVNPSPTQ